MMFDGLPEERWIKDILPQPGYVGSNMARRPCIQYLNQAADNLDKPIYFLAVRFTHWDQYPDLYGTAPDDMSVSMWRTEKARDGHAKRWADEGHRIIVGMLTPRKLIEVLGIQLDKGKQGPPVARRGNSRNLEKEDAMGMIIQTEKTVSETLTDLRKVFRKAGLEDYEPVPGEGPAYSVRYRQEGQPWATISSTLQPKKAQNLRVCYDVIHKLFVWAERGVSGVSQGVTFIGTAMAVSDNAKGDSLDEAFFTIGVDPSDDLEMVEAVYRAKMSRVHPDIIRDPTEKKQAEARAARLNKAMELIRKVKKGR